MDGSASINVSSRVSVRVVRDFDDMQRVNMVRTLVYIGEQNCPYDEEYDGNDLAGATHFLMECDGEPIGCLRVRWFAGFAKIERVCVRACYRHSRVSRYMIHEAIELIRRKGYRQIILHAQIQLESYWNRHGFERRSGRSGFAFSDRAYIEMEANFHAHHCALGIDSDPLVIDRPEGDWDRPGPLDESAMRGVSTDQFVDKNQVSRQ